MNSCNRPTFIDASSSHSGSTGEYRATVTKKWRKSMKMGIYESNELELIMKNAPKLIKNELEEI